VTGSFGAMYPAYDVQLNELPVVAGVVWFVPDESVIATVYVIFDAVRLGNDLVTEVTTVAQGSVINPCSAPSS
jgi:hypothetical protein